ncbi:phosphoglycerate kinase [Alphaproteobacteria bacterium]|nr:phosphoglycerate kinase [Alphaproteobacteria bacterium]MDC1209376.1 phosphoglycerate kinase [Pseudomonadota bacterium]
MSISIKNIINQNVKGKSVLLRADLNIPMFGAEITDTSRIKRLIPTIEFLKNSGAKVIICSHLGRPDGEFNEAYSLKPLLNKLSKALNIEVKFVESCIGSFAIKAKESLKPGEILLLENVRFHKGEIKNDIEFAEELSKKCDMFVNDAFSCSHRAHSSLHAITKFLPSYSGILLNEEVTALESVLNSPSKPIAALVGGAKISTKINIIEYLITKMDYIIIGGGMANTFLVANGFSVGKSLYEKDSVTLAKSILEKSKKYNCEIILPIDLVVANKFEANTDTQIVPFEMIPSDMMALDVGPKSINKMNDILTNVKTLLWNGPLGAFEIEPFGNGTFSLAKLASQLTEEKKLITVAGGGDTSFALNKAGVAEKFTYISSAGGAFLEWLEGIELPAISVLSNN